MAVLDIVTYPDPRLRQPTVAVEGVDEAIRALVRDLTDTMYAHDGAGIAAIQVGRPERIFLVDGRVATGDREADPVVFINPEIVETSGGVEGGEEGCLSFPGVFVDVRRPRRAKVRARDLDWNVFEIEGDGLLGRALQHEYDHLEGRLLIDMVGFVKKEMIRRRLKRWYAEQGRAPAAAL